MKERPILFSGEMVRAILDGRKTQTRRVIKPQPPESVSEGYTTYFCPYGIPGDRLWVRETFAPRLDVDPITELARARHYAMYKADGGDPHDPMHWHPYDKWIPSIFMPRWASRITLEITNVRVERVQDISVSECRAEGIPQASFSSQTDRDAQVHGEFMQLWDSINAKRGYSWESNPWVWVIEFKRYGEYSPKEKSDEV